MPYCWKCGETLPDNGPCAACGAMETERAPLPEDASREARAMRTIYDRYGCREVLTRPIMLYNGLGDLLGEDSRTLRNQIRTAMDAGLGQYYLNELGCHVDGFEERVLGLLTGAGISRGTARYIKELFDQMTGVPVREDEPGKGGRRWYWLAAVIVAVVAVAAVFLALSGGKKPGPAVDAFVTDAPTNAPTDTPTDAPTDVPMPDVRGSLDFQLAIWVADADGNATGRTYDEVAYRGDLKEGEQLWYTLVVKNKTDEAMDVAISCEYAGKSAVWDTHEVPAGDVIRVWMNSVDLSVGDHPVTWYANGYLVNVPSGMRVVADATPTEVPTEKPTETPTTEPTEVPTEEPASIPAATPPLTGVAANSADPSLIKDTVIYNGSSKVDNFVRRRAINMPIGDQYVSTGHGVLTYRGNAFRQNAAIGTVENAGKLSLLWTTEAGSAKGASSTYYGIGWTGQPAIVKWGKEIREASNIVAEKKSIAALKEVIIAGLDGRIYFLDLADGQETRPAINLGFPMRGTPSLHPNGYPIMAVGQYARRMASGTGTIGLRVYDTLTQEEIYWIDGLDGKANRPYYGVGAFDTSALIDPTTDTMVTIGTNGMLYTVDLETRFHMMDSKLTINPTVVSMKSRTSGQADKYTAVQSSPAMYGSYVYYADMGGILRCVDTTTMTTVWAVDTDDAVEAAIALDMDENGDLWLYTANTLDARTLGDCTIRRFNALTGEEDWALPVNLVKAKNGKIPGAMASPVIGQYELEDMVYFTLSNVSAAGATGIFGEGTEETAGVLLALDKVSGGIVWAHALDEYSYSSPVAVYATEGQGWIIQASSSGLITLLDGLTGTVISTLAVEGTIEASPAVYGNTLVIGTTGKNTSYIYGIRIQ